MAAKRKYYAVRSGRTTGIFESWSECELSVKGFSGAKYKSFPTLAEAQAYMGGAAEEAPAAAGHAASDSSVPPSVFETDRDVIAYVDGSFDAGKGRYSYGCIFLKPDGTEERISGCGQDPDTARLRNVAGEMLGAMHAVDWAVREGYASIEIRYDYEGIENWATGAWQAHNPYTAGYAQYMRKKREKIAISFWKVRAHTGHYYNEEVDKLAKAALED